MIVALLVIIWAVVLVYFWRRIEDVYTIRISVLSRISDLAKKDIAAGRDWEWRYKGYAQGPSYNTMILHFWKPLDSFFADAPYLR